VRLGRTLARATIGALFAAHGAQKLFGWWDGPGPEGTQKMMENLEMRPPKANAMLVGATEGGGGALFAAGVATPLTGGMLIATMITAIRKVHLAKGPWNADGGYEFNAALIAGILAVIGDTRRSALALALGAAGSTIAIEAGRRWPQETEEVDFAAPERAEEAARGPRFQEERGEEAAKEALLQAPVGSA
jgi:putative oxidoreductase